MNISGDFKAIVGFGIAMMLIVLVVVVEWSQRLEHSEEVRWLSANREIARKLTAIMALTTDGETGQRGFALTGNEAYLQPYQKFADEIQSEINNLSQVIAIRPDLESSVSLLKELLNKRAIQMEQLIAARKQGGLEAASAEASNGEGKATHDQIRQLIRSLQSNVSESIIARDNEDRTYNQNSRFRVIGALLMAILVVVAALYLQRKDKMARTIAEHAMHTLNQELSIATQQAKRADHLKSAFLATMSHEFRTPLNSIIGFIGILIQELPGPLNQEQKKQLSMVQNSSRHLLALVNDVLDISKIEADELRISTEWVDIEETIQKVMNSIRPQAAQKNLQLQMQIEQSLPAISTDQRRFEQILINLLHNAVKFTERGEISISANLQHPKDSINDKHNNLIIAVTDTGCGIQPNDIAEIFVPFRQISTGLARPHEGTGLGLTICHKLLQLMGGSISVVSELNTGSTFTITLPLRRESIHES